MREVEKGAMEAPGVRYPVAAADSHSSVVGEASGTNGLARVCSDTGHSTGGSLFGGPAHKNGDTSTQQQQQQQQQQQRSTANIDTVIKKSVETKLSATLAAAHQSYNAGRYKDAQALCESVYREEAYRTDNLLLLGAVHFQLKNFSECILYNQHPNLRGRRCRRLPRRLITPLGSSPLPATPPALPPPYSVVPRAPALTPRRLRGRAGAHCISWRAGGEMLLSRSFWTAQQCIRVDPNFAEAYSNLANALKELGDIMGAIQFYLKAVKLKPRFCDAYNNLASAYMQLGHTQEAIETYQMALVLNRGLVDAHSNLGNLYKTQGMLAEAKRCYLEAIRIQPSFTIAWSNLAGIFKEEGNLTTSVAYYREAIRLCPEFADAHSNLGNVLKEQGLIQDAMQCYHTAIKLRPDFAIAYGNLASCYYDCGCQELAIRAFRYAIQLEPNFPDAYNNLGNALRESGQLEEAIGCYRTTLRLKADHPHAYNNLGNAMKDKGLIKEAIHCYVTAVRLMPKFAAVHSNLGSVLKEQGKLGHALAHYHEAIAIDPAFADAYSNMGNAYKDMGRLQEAIKCYSAAINIKPTFADAYSNLASAYKEGGDVLQAITCYRKALALRPAFPDAFANLVHSLVFICDWSNRDEHFATLRKMLAEQMASDTVLPSVQPFHAMAYPLSLAEMQQISRKYAQRVKTNVALLEMPPFRFHRKVRGARIRVGYVSSDLGNHPLSHLMQSVFGMHDRTRFEIKCYALSSKDESVWRRKIEDESEHFCDVAGLQNGDVARLIHTDGIDILINLNGYTKGARNEIFALQPAPIQVSYLGFCGTLGADYMQYMIADHTLVPQESRRFYTEKMMYMPHSYFVNDHKQSARYVLDRTLLPSRAKYGVPEDRFVLCNFNQLYKMDPTIFSTWTAILRRVPNAVLWLLRFPPAGEENIRAEAKKRGVREEQLHFTDVSAKEEHIKRGYLADLFLDTPSCNAHTTGCDILWSGTPMLTMAGSKMATRVAPSLLKAAGVDELIVDSLEAYEETAVALATDPERLFKIRSRLEEGRHSCPLFDTQRWVRNMESGLAMAYDRFQAGLSPGDITIEDTVGATVGPSPGAGSAAPLASDTAPTSGVSASSEAASSMLPVEAGDSAAAASGRAQAQPSVSSLGVSPSGGGDGMLSSSSLPSQSPLLGTAPAASGSGSAMLSAAGSGSDATGETVPPGRPGSVAEGAEEPSNEHEMAGELKREEEESCASAAAEEDIEGLTVREAESFDAVGEMGRGEDAGVVPRTTEEEPVAIQSEPVTASPTGSEVVSAHDEDLTKEQQPEEAVRVRRKKRTIDEAEES